MNTDAARDIAETALIWLAERPERLGAFLDASGADPREIRARAEDPEFLGFVLDFLLASDAAVLDFCADRRLAPEVPARARAVLPGGGVPNWT
jgi:hypothetical protein